MATIDSLRRQPDVQDFSANSQFRVTMSNFPLSEWFCTAVTVPGITLGQVDRSSPLKMIPSVGDTLTYDNLDMTMMVDEELKNYQEIHDWMVNIGFPYSHKQFMAKERVDAVTRKGEYPLYSDMQLYILSSANNPKVVVKLYDAFPVSLSGLSYTTQDTDATYLTADVSFAYMYYEFSSV